MMASAGAWRGRRIEQQADHRCGGDQADQDQGGDTGDGSGGDRGRGEFVGPVRSGGCRDGRAGRGAGGGQPPGEDEYPQRGQDGRSADLLRMCPARYRADGAVRTTFSEAGLADGRGARSPTRPRAVWKFTAVPRIVGSIAMGLLPATNLRTKVFILPSSRLLVFSVAREPASARAITSLGCACCRGAPMPEQMRCGVRCECVSAVLAYWTVGASAIGRPSRLVGSGSRPARQHGSYSRGPGRPGARSRGHP
ncbi:Uncharacterised protein [Nocardia africana]|uniref:Uncharacterized protein n=1 Tax=Nocardia africana TaxID=134964 RepID=A0A378WMG6_9NOCA|nr:Uncharacterised protein [Nocardia africana]